MTMNTLNERLNYLGIDASVRDDLRSLLPLIEPELPVILEAFYAHIASHDETRDFFSSRERVETASKRQAEHWRRLFTGQFDEAYEESARRVGLVHHKINLSPSLYMGGYAFVIERLQAAILGAGYSRVFNRASTLARKLGAVTKAVTLDMDLALEVYISNAENAQRQAGMDEISAQFEAEFLAIADDVAQSAAMVRDAVDLISQKAYDSVDMSQTMISKSSTMKENVDGIAAAVEEMTGSIREISEQTTETARMGASATDAITATGETMSKLTHAAQSVGEIVSLIEGVAEQTNLLALNATIEAARAGEAGKGFAVVATEVKALASQTAGATEQISAQVADMQSIVTQAVQSIEAIGDIVSSFGSVGASISAAVEEQSAATQEISRNTSISADTMIDVHRIISDVGGEAEMAGEATKSVSEQVVRLQDRSAQMRENVGEFLSKLRA